MLLKKITDWYKFIPSYYDNYLGLATLLEYKSSNRLFKKTDLQALTLVGPTRENPVPDPLAVLHLHN